MSKWTLVLSSSRGMLKIIFISSPGAQIEDIELMNFFSGPDLIEMASSDESLLHLLIPSHPPPYWNPLAW